MTRIYEKAGKLFGDAKAEAKDVNTNLHNSFNQLKDDWHRETNKAKESFEKGKESSADKSFYDKAKDSYNDIHDNLFGEDGTLVSSETESSE